MCLVLSFVLKYAQTKTGHIGRKIPEIFLVLTNMKITPRFITIRKIKNKIRKVPQKIVKRHLFLSDRTFLKYFGTL